MWDWPIPAGLDKKDKALEEAEDVEMGEEEEDREEKPKEWSAIPDQGQPILDVEEQQCALRVRTTKQARSWAKEPPARKELPKVWWNNPATTKTTGVKKLYKAAAAATLGKGTTAGGRMAGGLTLGKGTTALGKG